MSLHLRRLMAKVSAALQRDVPTPIVAVVVGSESLALELSEKLWDEGFHCPAIRPPTVPVGTSRLRITLTAQHSEDDIDRLLVALSNLGALHKHSNPPLYPTETTSVMARSML